MRHRAFVTEVAPLAPSVLQLTVAFEGEFAFQPGQWVNIGLDEGVTRAYTIASAPARPQAVQLCIRIGQGKGTTAVSRLKAGDVVGVDGPFGGFLAPEGDPRPVVFLAGDVGIAPVRSIVLHLIASGDPRKRTVLYEPDQRHILYAGDFDPLARAGKIRHESGPIEMLIDRHRAELGKAVLMAAGFDPFLKRVRQALDRAGAGDAPLVTESFGPEP